MSDQRPDPDQLLQPPASRKRRRRSAGKLKIFFGASAGVGKTYAMLAAARAPGAQGVDVVVGVVETHGRAETEALLAGLELLPLRQVSLPRPHAAGVRPRRARLASASRR